MQYTFHYIYDDPIHNGSKFFECSAFVDHMPSFHSPGNVLKMTHEFTANTPLFNLWEFVKNEKAKICGSPVLLDMTYYPWAGAGRLYGNNIEIRLDKLLMTSYIGGFNPTTLWSLNDINFVWNP